jgi:formylglycine-generating enzyme required for sulfatase activity
LPSAARAAHPDPRFNELGIVYRGANFKPLPLSRHGEQFRYGLVWAGRMLSDRPIYRRFGSHAAARAAGAAIVRLPARVAWEWAAA